MNRASKPILTLGAVGALLSLGALALAPVAPAASSTSAAAKASFTADPVHSSAVFSIMHGGAARFWGYIDEIKGDFTLDDSDPSASSFTFEVPVESVYTGNAQRDQHLKSADFFNAAQFPTVTFESSSVRSAGNNMYEVTGDLTLLGETKPITATVEKTGEGEFGGKARTGVEAKFTIKRTDFGMAYGVDQGVLGDDVTMIVSIEGIKQ